MCQFAVPEVGTRSLGLHSSRQMATQYVGTGSSCFLVFTRVDGGKFIFFNDKCEFFTVSKINILN